MHIVGGKLLNGIKNVYVNSLTCIKIKGGEIEYFRTDVGVTQCCIISCWLFNVYMDAMMKEVKISRGRERMKIT